jgi:hypothetical protein
MILSDVIISFWIFVMSCKTYLSLPTIFVWSSRSRMMMRGSPGGDESFLREKEVFDFFPPCFLFLDGFVTKMVFDAFESRVDVANLTRRVSS